MISARRNRTFGPVAAGAVTLLAAAFVSTPALGQELHGTGALVGGTLVDGTGAPAVEGAVVIFREGRIECAGTPSACPVPEGIPTLDVTGRWIIPGLIDGHMHYSQTGWADGRPDQATDWRDRFPYATAMAENRSHPERYFQAYLCSGVTATWDVGGYPWTWDLRARAEHDPDAPHIAAAGPLLSARDHWLNLPGEKQFLYMSDAQTVEDAARYIVRSGADQVKVWYLVNPTDEDAPHFQEMIRIGGRVAHEAGKPLIVHATGLWQAKDALRAGATHLVHSVYDQEVDDEFIRLAREAGASYNPTLTVFKGVQQFAERHFDGSHLDLRCVDPGTLAKVELTSDAPNAPSPEDVARRARSNDDRYALMLRNLKRVHDAGIPIVMGTDAGNTLTLHGPAVFAEMESMQEAGLTPMDVLVASTRNAALAMGRPDLGTVEVGKVADLVILAEDPTEDISAVRSRTWIIREGWAHSLDALRFR